MSDDNAEYTYLWQRRYEIKVRALANRIYHQERQRIFEQREGLIKAASILAGSIAFAKVTDPAFTKESASKVIQWCSVIITGGSTLSLVFGYGNKARDSAKRSSSWALLERDIDAIGERDFTEEQINQWFAKANDIEADEPAQHQLLFKLCCKRAIKALGGEDNIKIGWFEAWVPPILFPFIP